MGVLVVLSLAAIPVGVLVSTVRDPTMHRRPRFVPRLAGLVGCMVLPWVVTLIAPVGDQAVVTLLLLGLAWALLLVVLAPRLLFGGPGSDHGPSDGGGPGPRPGDDRPPPRPPGGGIPLPDAEQSAARVRGPHKPGRAVRFRRGAREHERRPSRVRGV